MRVAVSNGRSNIGGMKHGSCDDAVRSHQDRLSANRG
jgi:hypothetical protein